MGTVAIIDYDGTWPKQFGAVQRRLLSAAGDLATRIDHIGSTSVSGLAAKDVIDVQVTVKDEPSLEVAADALAKAGWIRSDRVSGDHHFPGADPPEHLRKILLSQGPDERPTNIHVRVDGWPNQRYALLFRDYLRANQETAEAYAELKRRLAELLPDDPGRYADVKDPACDLIYLAAEQWATRAAWVP
ncbi:MAG: hypothetical protein QOI81_144 [Actinomycetota bacterium]|nr:hypothetical protein [Actinomycetota bacterium]